MIFASSIICTLSFANLAIRYNGKNLYEELVDKSDFDPRQNESIIETEEPFLLRKQRRTDATEKTSIRNESYNASDDSKSEQDENNTPSTY